ncbi:hypothetical protein C1637_07175 [Chryseobacterium lactis]|nr:hypothetical protein [Sphingobacterium multivorum]AZA84612.1 hypothetical protein EG342_23145 [Chryseobacterium lactis]AZB05000.1 hypothetical protein EG341_14025 [Chryseobacterium lactis]KMQ64470.1 hypothetical protein ACM46_09365 [Chryseobacterium angstadtii]PNW14731.1 hypothetical protein C1637_07175 [Chryseobacterium lactis]
MFVLSFIAFISTQRLLFENHFDFSPDGMSFYINQFSKFNGLFAATITIILAYYGIERLKAAERANIDKVRLDRYSDWKTITDARIDVVKDENPLFRREFINIRYQLFEDLYPAFAIENKKQLRALFNKYFANLIPAFESNNKKQQGCGGIYQSAAYTYFGQNFLFVFLGSVIGVKYDNATEDLLEMYLASLPSDRIIDSLAYQSALERYIKYNN